MPTLKPDLSPGVQTFLSRSGAAAFTVSQFAVATVQSEAHASALLAQLTREGHLSRHTLSTPVEVSALPRQLVYRARRARPAAEDAPECCWTQSWPEATVLAFTDALSLLSTASEQGNVQEDLRSQDGLSVRRLAWRICLELGALDADLDAPARALQARHSFTELIDLAATLRLQNPERSVQALYAAGLAAP